MTPVLRGTHRADVPRGRLWAARGRWAAGSALLTLAALVRLLTTLVVAVIVLGILLVVLSANPANTIVHDVHVAARTLVGPFKGIFAPHNAKLAIALNWGLAAAVYLFVGRLIARLIAAPASRRTAVAPVERVP